ncbi:aminotransferase class V-fold PLP-dependent enzyme, partial [Mesorhizobium sp. M1312]
GDHTGSIVALGDPASLGGSRAGESRIQTLHDHLMKNQVIVSMRRGMLRFSLHLYNTADEVDQVVRLTKDWLS